MIARKSYEFPQKTPDNVAATKYTKNLNSKQVREGRQYMKTYTNVHGTTIRVGDLVEWDWNLKQGEERIPYKVLAIFRDTQLQYYPNKGPETVWIDVDIIEVAEEVKTFDGKRKAIVKRCFDVDTSFLPMRVLPRKG